MPFANDGLKEELLENDEEFRRLYDEHQNYARRLEELHVETLPSQEEELEEKQIKLHKLRLKDRMQAILHSHRTEQVSA